MKKSETLSLPTNDELKPLIEAAFLLNEVGGGLKYWVTARPKNSGLKPGDRGYDKSGHAVGPMQIDFIHGDSRARKHLADAICKYGDSKGQGARARAVVGRTIPNIEPCPVEAKPQPGSDDGAAVARPVETDRAPAEDGVGEAPSPAPDQAAPDQAAQDLTTEDPAGEDLAAQDLEFLRAALNSGEGRKAVDIATNVLMEELTKETTKAVKRIAAAKLPDGSPAADPNLVKSKVFSVAIADRINQIGNVNDTIALFEQGTRTLGQGDSKIFSIKRTVAADDWNRYFVNSVKNTKDAARRLANSYRAVADKQPASGFHPVPSAEALERLAKEDPDEDGAIILRRVRKKSAVEPETDSSRAAIDPVPRDATKTARFGALPASQANRQEAGSADLVAEDASGDPSLPSRGQGTVPRRLQGAGPRGADRTSVAGSISNWRMKLSAIVDAAKDPLDDILAKDPATYTDDDRRAVLASEAYWRASDPRHDHTVRAAEAMFQARARGGLAADDPHGRGAIDRGVEAVIEAMTHGMTEAPLPRLVSSLQEAINRIAVEGGSRDIEEFPSGRRLSRRAPVRAVRIDGTFGPETARALRQAVARGGAGALVRIFSGSAPNRIPPHGDV